MSHLYFDPALQDLLHFASRQIIRSHSGLQRACQPAVVMRARGSRSTIVGGALATQQISHSEHVCCLVRYLN